MSLINEDEVKKRLNSPLNLINRMKSGMKASNNARSNAMSLFVRANVDKPDEPIPPRFNPFAKEIKEEPIKKVIELETSEVVDDVDTKIGLALAHNNALRLVNRGIEMLHTKMDDVKPDNIPAVINAAGKIIDNIRKERIEKDKNYKNDQHVHHHFYMPEQKKLEDYQVIEVSS